MKLNECQIKCLKFIYDRGGSFYSLKPVYCWPEEVHYQTLLALERKKLLKSNDNYYGIHAIWRITELGKEQITLTAPDPNPRDPDSDCKK